MTRLFHHTAFAAGLLAIAWVASGYLPGNPFALALLAPIAAAFLLGALELHRFQQASSTLSQQLVLTTEAPPALAPWIARLHPSLHSAVQLRVQGERVALPGPALTPYLTGLLVLLGMLGTFLGMVVTLQGTGLALENASNVEAIRASLAAPVKGLGLAFGTSVAGVAASAMLGLMSALARRDRQRAAQLLDTHIATTLRGFSQAQQREESLHLQRAQAQVMNETLPALVGQLQALVAQMALQGPSLQAGLLASQARFQGEALLAFTGLAESVDRSLKTSLSESARLAGASIEPAVRSTLAGLSQESRQLRDTLALAVQSQLDGVSARMDGLSNTLAERWQAAMADQQRHSQAVTQGLHAGMDRFAQTFEQRSAALLRQVAEANALASDTALQREHERLHAWHDGLATWASTLQHQGQQHADAVAAREQQVCTTLEVTAQAITAQAGAQARATLDEIGQLLQAASQAPRVAAELIGELRLALSNSLVRDNAALDERNQLLGTLGHLLAAVNHASTEQRSAIDALVQTSTELLDRAATRFAGSVDSGSRKLQDVAVTLTGSAAEVASLGEGFGVAVQLFSRASEQLMAQLQRVEAALGQSMARSDEQLAYYVAQAREIVDLTLGSHKQIVDDLQQLARPPAAPTVARAA